MLRFSQNFFCNLSRSKRNLDLNSLFIKYNNTNCARFWQKITIAAFSSDASDTPKGENPIHRTVRIIKNDFKRLNRRMNDLFGEYHPDSIFPEHCDVVIIGGGVMGSSIAYWLQQRALDGLRVVVVEKDSAVNLDNSISLEYKQASTVLSVGGLRQQFSASENIQMSLFGAEFIRNINEYLLIPGEEPPDVNFNHSGYLLLASEMGVDTLKENFKLQSSLGAKSELLTAKRLKAKFPWINTDGVELGCHGLENEGWLDPWSLLTAFKRKAISLGTEYVDGEVISFDFMNIPGTEVEGVESGTYEGTHSLNVKTETGEIKKINFALCVIAAGCNSGEVAKLLRMGSGPGTLRIPLPVEPRKRYVFNYHCSNGPGLNTPLTVDPTGTYFRRDGLGGNFICGCCPPPEEEPDCCNLDVDHNFFDEKLWPVLAHRVPAFEALKVKSAWAGYYDYNFFDRNGIIGSHPGYTNLYLATGFSGHGLQQAAAVGRAIMELIIDGRFVTIDLTRMGFERILKNEPLYELNIV